MHLHIYPSALEADRIRRAAAEAGISMSEFVRKAAIRAASEAVSTDAIAHRRWIERHEAEYLKPGS